MYSKYIDNAVNDDNSFLSMDDILENILNYETWRNSDLDPYTKAPLNYKVSKYYEENQKIEIKKTEFTYNYIQYSYDSVIAGQENNPIPVERLKTTYGSIVIYTDGARTQYLVDRARGSTALRILRVINNSDKQKIIEAQSFNINEDFFIWLISRFMEDTRIIDEKSSLSINRIIGFKGEGNQKQAVLSGSGNDVMNLLSSLSFLIEMDVMTEIEVRIEFEKETYELRFYSKNSQFDILTDNYIGEHMMLQEDEKEPRLLMSTIIEVIPAIINAYNEEVSSENWTASSKKEFIFGLIDSVKEKIEFLYPS